jgi:hypothetical protein
MKITRVITVVLSSIFLLASVGFLIKQKYHPFAKLYTDIVLDGSDPYLTCQQKPIATEAEKMVKDNEQELNKLKEYDNGIYWWVDSSKCNNEKGELLIFYGSHQTRLEIEKVIKNNNFHGVPVVLNNI